MPLSKEHLDAALAAGCQVPGCDHKGETDMLYLKSGCHPDAALCCFYKGDGCVYVQCKECDKPVTSLLISSLVNCDSLPVDKAQTALTAGFCFGLSQSETHQFTDHERAMLKHASHVLSLLLGLKLEGD